MAGVDGDVVLNRLDDAALDVVVPAYLFGPFEDERVVGYDEVAALLDGFVDDGLRDVQGDEYA